MCEYFPTFLTSSAADVELGYITPGHGAHGKQLWISDVTDIEDMYNEYRGKKEIILSTTNQMKEEGKKKNTTHLEKLNTPKRANYRTTAQRKWKEVKRKHTGDYTGKVETMGSSHPNGETHFLYPAT